MISHLRYRTRRDILATLAIAGAASAACRPARLLAQGASANDASHDWAWLTGSWDVAHHRLKARLAGSHDWQDFTGRSNLWLTMGGLGTIDDNIIDLPEGSYRASGIRAFDPESGKWAIWWLDGRDPTTLGTPAMGRFTGDAGTFAGNDMLRGQPVAAELRWSRIHSARPHWEQAYSPDGGRSWEVNWAMDFTRTSRAVKPFPRAAQPAAPRDWDFLVGSWSVAHRRLKHRLAGNNDWERFTGTLVNWPLLGGMGNVGDNLMNFPAGAYRGIGLRAFDAKTGQWLSWWLYGRDPMSFAPPMRGGFAGGVATMNGNDSQDGKPILVRVIWSRITPTSARWEQACSADNGATWETNWISDFTRRA
ncbi:MAG: hypothetical protein JWL96_1275 [Sphingomonas bacterium]|uniref:hypothetical protein n=1 Tax=Sphingomonas bacterium TaxID=1895847 RepID=UPI00262078B9|nr:hypothetical protein [Sphingomonas bacterium]MDB5709205.1 hypothetical protein [Sphingomonas bacterium]